MGGFHGNGQFGSQVSDKILLRGSSFLPSSSSTFLFTEQKRAPNPLEAHVTPSSEDLLRPAQQCSRLPRRHTSATSGAGSLTFSLPVWDFRWDWATSGAFPIFATRMVEVGMGMKSGQREQQKPLDITFNCIPKSLSHISTNPTGLNPGHEG
ncbi:unnamed protein product [Protopolystoma xenopodis]|uniref:Uncharacterized protein n=1 Tax=Protopolystoma xenopodis TaxID=117903 RepID=A0A3S5FDK2_9PLAT|nr:unnamed protein product [Protopolystoma xenopodis]